MWLASKGQSEAGRRKRRAVPIHVYVGHNGDGKSLHAVWDTLPSLEEGRPCLSTVRLLDYLDPRPCEGWETVVKDWVQETDRAWRPVFERVDCSDPWHGLDEHQQAHPLYVRFTKWPQLLAWRFGDVLMDEVTGVADASDWAAVPQAVVNKFPQLRRDECALRITTLSYSNCNKRIRQAALAVTRCKGTMPASTRSEFGMGRVYRPRRMSSAVTYDAKTLPMDDPTNGAYDKARVIGRSRLWVPDCVARLAYDTYAPVDSVGTVTDAGNCAYCGGTRRRAECTCADYVSDRADRRAGSGRSPRSGEHRNGSRPAGRHAVDHVHSIAEGASA
jgi:hypothetical protein